LNEGEGFLIITGEVGTGKSTLCRAFLQDLDQSVACAYIFNPKLNALQLLKSINAEFGIPADTDSPHELIETLNTFLIAQKAEEQKVMIIIDEAQNLPVESLEQVRLLSNLETSRDKLVQIVLVGQPELAKMIDSFELRQLGQRISLACNLMPLSYDETVLYIQHRINVASFKPQMPFEKGTLKALFGFSQGVPRLINTACDRMLLAAFLRKQSTISPQLATEIINELTLRGRKPQPSGFPWRKAAIAAFASILLTAAVVWVAFDKLQLHGHLQRLYAASMPRTKAPAKTESTTLPESPPMPVALEPGPDSRHVTGYGKGESQAVAVPTERPEATVALEELATMLLEADSRRQAFLAILQQWGMDPKGDMDLSGVDDTDYFQLVAERHGLSIHIVKDDIDELAKLNLPAIVRLELPRRNSALYASLIGIEEDQYFFTSHDLGVNAQVDQQTFRQMWGRIAVVPWKNYLGYRGVIPGGAPNAAIVVLKQLLWELGHSQLTIDDRYDILTRNAVREVQAKNGLKVDGMVGDLTKIVLFNEKQGLPIPHLQR
jgi:general secretion pathway protein A